MLSDICIFYFNGTASTENYSLSLHDALPILIDPNDRRKVLREEELFDGEYGRIREVAVGPDGALYFSTSNRDGRGKDRKSTRLNSSHSQISYAVFCLKKKKCTNKI